MGVMRGAVLQSLHHHTGILRTLFQVQSNLGVSHPMVQDVKSRGNGNPEEQ